MFRRTTPCIFLLLSALALGAATLPPERFWLAGRYDGNRVVVYLDAVKFGGPLPADAVKIPEPVADAFFSPVALPASYIARFQTGSNAEHFSLGDRYDLLLSGGQVETITLTTLVGCETDEQVGNDSYIGALGTVDMEDGLAFQRDYYAVRRHVEREGGDSKAILGNAAGHTALQDEPVRFDTQTQVASQLQQRLKLIANQSVRWKAEKISPAFKIQPFTIANGSLRYYVRAEWRSGNEPNRAATFALAAWMTPQPTLRIMGIEQQTSPYDFEHELPVLRNVVDLGGGRTGIIVETSGEDSRGLMLLEYRDGADLNHMRTLQSISTGE